MTNGSGGGGMGGSRTHDSKCNLDLHSSVKEMMNSFSRISSENIKANPIIDHWLRCIFFIPMVSICFASF